MAMEKETPATTMWMGMVQAWAQGMAGRAIGMRQGGGKSVQLGKQAERHRLGT